MSDPQSPESIIRAEVPAHDPRQLHLVIDNPKARNGITDVAMRELGALIDRASADPAVRVVVLRGAGEHFCSGADLRAAGKVLAGGAEGARRALAEGYHRAIEALAACTKPTLAVIRGACVGFGFDLACAADLRVCADDATFGQVFSKIALVPDGGSSFTLPRLVGLGKAMELFLLGERFSGAEAARLGVVNRAVAAAELDALAAEWATKLAGGPPIAYRLGKENLRAGASGGTLADALVREQEAQARCLTSRDALRGVKAFFDKASPTFEGD